MLVRELMHFILFETSVLFPTRRIVSSRRTSSGSKCLDAIIYAGLYLCTLLPRPLLSSQKTVLCLTRKFVSSWKNPFGSKWLDSVRTAKGYIVHFTSSPLSVVLKISLSPNPKSMLCFGRFQKGRPLLALVWIFALLQNFQISQFGLFPPLPPRHSLPDPWNVRENS